MLEDKLINKIPQDTIEFAVKNPFIVPLVINKDTPNIAEPTAAAIKISLNKENPNKGFMMRLIINCNIEK